jgi:chromate transporter
LSEPGNAYRPTHRDLFSAFCKVGVLGFGGVAALARHVLVVERKLLSERDFAESFGLASTLPGANTVNLAAMLGDRFRGLSGACVSLAGLMIAPLMILVVIALFYSRYGQLADVRAALFGAAAAAAGVVAGTSLRILSDLEPDWRAVIVVAGVCLAAIAKIPMLAILAVAVPLSIAGTFMRRRRS